MLAVRLRSLVLRNRVGRALYVMIDNLDRHHAPVAASAMAFDTFLSLVPLTALAGYVLGHVHETGDILFGPVLLMVFLVWFLISRVFRGAGFGLVGHGINEIGGGVGKVL